MWNPKGKKIACSKVKGNIPRGTGNKRKKAKIDWSKDLARLKTKQYEVIS